MSGISKDPLFVGLTRPSMFLGVSLPFFASNMMISLMAFIQISDLRILLMAFALHIVGYILCYKEPRFVEIYLMKYGNFNKCPNKSHYGANSYYI